MNSIEFKGVSSTTIDGLIICELPPISKPPMRINETMVDGRHGSRIEELGYSSYDKAVNIGLHGNFDINKVIKYFSGEGDIVFSNEPDKVYRGQVINQIDYNRLLRFRQATVTFRVQPFKHKHREAYAEAPTATASGTSLVLNGSTNARFKSFRIFGKSKQGGTPTPSAPIDIVSLGEDGNTSLNISGANLAKEKTIIQASVQYGSILFVEADIKPNTQYAISFKGSVGNRYYFNEFLFTYKNITVKEGTNIVTVTTANNIDKSPDKYVSGKGWIILKNDIVQPKTNVFDNFMLNEGGVAMPYQPYTEQTIALKDTLSGIPVTDASLATYTDASGQMWCADEIDLKRGVRVERMRKITFTGAEAFTPLTVVSTATYHRYNYKLVTPYLADVPNSKVYDGLCSHYGKSSADDGYNGKGLNTTSLQNTDINFYVEYSTVDSFKAFLAEQYANGTPIEVLYRLATPIETPLTEAEITACKSLLSNEPTTTIINDENADMAVEYFKPYEVFNEGLETSKPKMVLKGSGTVELKVNGKAVFTYTFPSGENEVVIDSETEDAYLGAALKNRNMFGDFPELVPKTNKIEWSGDVTSIEILPRSRWL